MSQKTQYDLIVIGAGILGTFHALHALKAGKTVLLTEKDQYPVGATVRNFGQAVVSGMSSDWFEYARRSTEIYNKIQKKFDISLRNNGTVYISSDHDEQQLIEELKLQMDEKDYSCELLLPDNCVKKWPALNHTYCKGGLFFPQEVSLEPDKLIYRLIDYALREYPDFSYQPSTLVTECTTTAGGVQIKTSSGNIFNAEKAIVCCGAEFKLLFSDLFQNSGIVISKLQMMRTIPLPQVALEGNILTGLSIRRYESFQECPSFSKVNTPEHYQELKKWGIHILFKKATDGSFIIGDSHEYADVAHTEDLGFGINNQINELMLGEAQKIVSFNVHQIAATWAGFYSQHNTKHIVEYDIDDRIHIRTAIGGKGMTSSPGYAEASIKKIYG